MSPLSWQETVRQRLDVESVVVLPLRPDLPEGSEDEAKSDQGEVPLTRKDGSCFDYQGEIARGGMGAILRVWDKDLHRPLAMKVILGSEKSQGRSDISTVPPEKLARFLEEAQVTAQLDHPGVVPVHELGLSPDGRVYFTMRLVQGRELGTVFELARREDPAWSLTRVLGVMVKVCQTLAYAHSKGVVHRDLKPGNVMVGNYGEVYVMDWGLAKVKGAEDKHDLRIPEPEPREEEPRSNSPGESKLTTQRSEENSPVVTIDGTILGTPAYMAPEQAQGKLDLVDERSDIYSLGAILYTMLTGQIPYVRKGESATAKTILAMLRGWGKYGFVQPPQSILEVDPNAAPELVAICERAMSRERDERYESCVALSEDLQAYLDGRVVQAYETGSMAEAKKWVRRNRGAAVTLASTVLVGLSILIWMIVSQSDKRDALERRAEGLEGEIGRLQAEERKAETYRSELENEKANLQKDLAASNARQAQVSFERALAFRSERDDTSARLSALEALTGDPKHSRARGLFLSSTPASRLWTVPARVPLDRLVVGGSGSVLIGAHAREIRVWDVSSGTARETWRLPRIPVQIAAGSDHVAVRFDDGRVGIFEFRTGKSVGELTESATIGFAGETLVSAGAKRVSVWTPRGVIGVATPRGADPTRVEPIPAGKWFALGGADGSVQVLDSASGRPIAELPANGSPVVAFAFPNSAEEFVVATDNGALRRYTFSNGGIDDLRAGGSDAIVSAFYTGPSRLVTVARRGRIELWSGALPVRKVESRPVRYAGKISAGQRAILSFADGGVEDWDLFKLERSRLASGIVAVESLVGYDSKSELLGVRTQSGQVHFVSAETGSESFRPLGPYDYVRFSADSSAIVSERVGEVQRVLSIGLPNAGQGRLIQMKAREVLAVDSSLRSFVGARSGRRLLALTKEDGRLVERVLDESWGQVSSAAWVSSQQLIVGTTTGHLVAYTGSDPETVPVVVTAHSGAVRSLKVSDSNQRVLSLGDDASVRAWTVSPEEIRSVHVASEFGSFGAKSIDVSPSGEWAVIAGERNGESLVDIVYWEGAATEHVARRRTGTSIQSAAFAGVGKVAIVKTTGNIELWSIPLARRRPYDVLASDWTKAGSWQSVRRSNDKIQVVRYQEQDRTTHVDREILQVSDPARARVLTGGYSVVAYVPGENSLFVARLGEKNREIKVRAAIVTAALDRKGRELVVSTARGSVISYHLARKSRGGASRVDKVSAVAVGQTAERVAVARTDGRVSIVDLEKNERKNSFAGTGAVRTLSFSGDDTKLAIGYADGTVKLWAPAEDRIIWSAKTGMEPASIDLSPDGVFLALSGRRDGRAVSSVWSIRDTVELATWFDSSQDWTPCPRFRSNSASVLALFERGEATFETRDLRRDSKLLSPPGDAGAAEATDTAPFVWSR
ncbi:MAG: protein kinase [Planctomycetota bacterium]